MLGRALVTLPWGWVSLTREASSRDCVTSTQTPQTRKGTKPQTQSARRHALSPSRGTHSRRVSLTHSHRAQCRTQCSTSVKCTHARCGAAVLLLRCCVPGGRVLRPSSVLSLRSFTSLTVSLIAPGYVFSGQSILACGQQCSDPVEGCVVYCRGT